MLDFLRSLFNPPPPSGATAKERLRLVLVSDHLSLAPDVVAALKKDLLAVITRYVTIDSAHADVTFEHRENEVAMLANIPITGVHDRSPSTQAPPEPEHPAAAPAPPPTAAPKAAARRRRRKKAPGTLAATERKSAAQPQSGYSAQA